MVGGPLTKAPKIWGVWVFRDSALLLHSLSGPLNRLNAILSRSVNAPTAIGPPLR